jgi:UDP-N-acetylmuramoyl-L-alanyl-D-glutamate--2,6-diaminopimelate ligase
MWQAAKNIYHLFQGNLALLLYGFPGRKMTIIGVTGTDGKTTTASLIYHCLITAGKKAALISSVGAVINEKASDIGFHVTTPGRFAVQSYLKKARRAKVEYVVLEVTSHALDQHRVHGVPFAIGVITNVTKEHLDYHKTYDRYVHAKAKLLNFAKTAVINKDDASYLRIKKHEIKDKYKKVVTYGMKKDSDVNPHRFTFRTKLIGKFNQYNSLATIAVLQQLHVPDPEIRKGLTTFKAPTGRQEVIYDKEFTVINDFAHTPNSFASVLPEIKKMTQKRLIHVFGAAALRDTYKRPEMGKISDEFADIIVLTSEDPRNEGPDKIMDEISKGIKKHTIEKNLFKITDRKEAINFAISLAEK